MKRKLLLPLILIPLILTIQVGFAAQADLPHHIHLTWQRDDLSHAMTVTWQSLEEGSGSTVLYDTEPRGGDPGLYAYSAEGVAHTYSGASGFIHDVELAGLEPETTYYLTCGGEGGWSGEMAFKTAPLGRRDLRFVVGGGQQVQPGGQEHGLVGDEGGEPQLRVVQRGPGERRGDPGAVGRFPQPHG